MGSSETALQETSTLLRHSDAGVVTLTLNRPNQFNSLSESLLDELQNALDRVAKEPETRVVVLAGNGKAFCAGHDLKEMRSTPDEQYYQRLFAQCGQIMLSMRALPQPVIAKVQGLATAAGCQLVAASDLAVASDNARFAVSGINVGLFCSTPAVPLSRNLSRKDAFEMLVTGDFIDAHTAQTRGLVNKVVEPGALDSAVSALCDSIVQKSPLAIETGKRMFYEQLEKDLADAYDYAGNVMAHNMMADDVSEGIDAFLEKRKPTWTGK